MKRTTSRLTAPKKRGTYRKTTRAQRRRKTSALNRVNKVKRGGFSVAGAGGAFRKPPTIGGSVPALAKYIAKAAPAGASPGRLSTLLSATGKVAQYGIPIAGTVYAQLMKKGFDGSEKPVLISRTDTAKRSVTGTYEAKSYTSNVKIGSPSTGPVKDAMKMYGKYTKELVNSLSDIKADPLEPENSQFQNNERRAQTNLVVGFNQKTWTAFDPGIFPTYRDIYLEFINVAPGYGTPQKKKERVYGMALSARTSFKFSNSNSYFPVKLKLHLISHRNEYFVSESEILKEFVSNSPTSQEANRLPIRYQYGGIVNQLDHSDCNVSRRAQLTMAPGFRDNFQIAHTLTKTLKPNDVWTAHFDESYGPGLDLGEIRSRGSLNTPLHFSLIVEMTGVECEGIQQEVTPPDPESLFNPTYGNPYKELGTYIGSSPGEVNFEFKKSITYVQSPDIEFETLADGDGVKMKPAFRAFVTEPREEKEFNVDFEEVGFPGQSDSTLFVPVMTDKDLRFANPLEGQKGGSEAILRDIRALLSPLSLPDNSEDPQ